MGIALKEIKREDVQENFEFFWSLIREIWTIPKSSEEAKRNIKKWVSSLEETGSYFLLKNHGGDTVGLTGYYLWDDVVGLRHHGVCPRFQKMGYSTKALDVLSELVLERSPRSRYVYEAIPKHRIEALKPIFEKMGFEAVEDEHGLLDEDEYYKGGVVMRRPIIK